MRNIRLILISASLTLFCGCLTTSAERSGSITAIEARSLVATFIGNKAWDIQTDSPTYTTVREDEEFFHFWVIIDPESNEKMDFYVRKNTGDIFEYPGGALIQTRAALDKIRARRLPKEYEDSIWMTDTEDDFCSYLTLSNKLVTVEFGSLVATGSISNYSTEDQQILVDWILLYDSTSSITTDLDFSGHFTIENGNSDGHETITALDSRYDGKIDFLNDKVWIRIEAQRPNI